MSAKTAACVALAKHYSQIDTNHTIPMYQINPADAKMLAAEFLLLHENRTQPDERELKSSGLSHAYRQREDYEMRECALAHAVKFCDDTDQSAEDAVEVAKVFELYLRGE